MSENHEKFMFNMHIFDEPEVEEIEEEEEDNLPPPPPTFSESELHAAKDTAFEKGRAQAAQEAQTSLETRVGLTLEKIAEGFLPLLEAEEQREKRFEDDVIILANGVFDRLLPHMMEKYGFNELKSVLEEVLSTVQGHAELLIAVHPEEYESLSAHIAQIQEKWHISAKISVEPRDTLAAHGFDIEWKNGGASYDLESLGEKIAQDLKEKLEQLKNTPQSDDKGEGNAEETQETQDQQEDKLAPPEQSTHDGDVTSEEDT